MERIACAWHAESGKSASCALWAHADKRGAARFPNPCVSLAHPCATRARLRGAGHAFARANKSLKDPGWNPGFGAGLLALPPEWLRLAKRSATCNIDETKQNRKEHAGQARPRSGAGAFQRELHSCQRPMRGKHLHVIIAYACFTGHVASRYRIHFADGKPWAQIPMRQFVFRAGISHWQLRSAKMPQGRGGGGGRAALMLVAPRGSLDNPRWCNSILRYSPRGSSPRLMAHKAIAPTTEQRKVCLKLHRCADQTRSCRQGSDLDAPLGRAWAQHG